MKTQNEIQSWKMWSKQCCLFPGQFATIILLILIYVPFSLLLVVIVPYFIQALNSNPTDISWSQLLGNQLALIISPLVKDTSFQQGISLSFQEKYFAFFFFFFALIYSITNYLSDSLLRDYGEKIAKHYRFLIAKKYLSYTFYSAIHVNPGLLSAMVGEDIREAQQSFTRLLSSLFKDGLTCIIYLGWLILLDVQLFFLLLAILIPAAIVLRITGKILKKLSREGLEFESELLSSLLERMRGWQTIQVFQAVEFEIKKFDHINSKIYNVWRRATRARALGTPLVEWLGIIAGCFIFVTALRRISDGLLSSHILIAFMVTVGFLSDKLNRMANQLNSSRKGTDSLHRILRFLQAKAPSRCSQPLSLETNFTLKSIVLDNVGIGYQTNNPLNTNINMSIKPGDFIAIVGPSGVGKSTLMKTLLGLQKTLQGHIFLNGVIMDENSLDRISSSIGFIPQDPFLFTGTIWENIVYPQKPSWENKETQKEILNALALGQLNKNPQDDIQGLSGGEKQRLMFARLFFHKPKLIFIDEGTSALDLANEQKVLENVKTILHEAAIIAIAHRPFVKSMATQIVDLSKFK